MPPKIKLKKSNLCLKQPFGQHAEHNKTVKRRKRTQKTTKKLQNIMRRIKKTLKLRSNVIKVYMFDFSSIVIKHS